MPEVVKEVSRESDDSLNDRSSQIIEDTNQYCSSFHVKDSKQKLMNRIMPHHCKRESEEFRNSDIPIEEHRDTMKA